MPGKPHTKTNNAPKVIIMNTTYKLSLTAFSLAIIALFTLSSCKTTSSGTASGVHTMGSPQSGYKMADRDMPGR